MLILCAASMLTTGFAAPQKPVSPPAIVPAQESEPVTVDSARPVTEIIDANSAYLATVSPDGRYIAWGQQSGKRQDRVLQLCLFEFETAAKQCSDLSPDVFDGYPYQFQWSPDSRYIAFSENPVEIASESDIWLFDTQGGTFTDLTDDGLVGIWSYLASEGEQAVLDYLPMWNARDGMIYFWRIVPLGNFRYTIGLYRIATEGGEPELVRDLTAQFAAQIPLYDYERFFLDGVSAIAPDGNSVAALMTTVNEMGGTEQSLWTIDLADTKAAPVQLAGVEDFMSAIPEWAQDFPPQAQGLSWTADGAGIVVVVNTALNPSIPFQVYYYVDAAGGGITPVVDFSGLEELDSYSEPAPGSELPWRVYSPWTGSLSPQGDKLLMVNDLGGTVALFTAPLPPTGELPLVSASADESPSTGVANSSRGDGGKVIAWGLLLNIIEQ
jgi:hypothetical protein